MSEELTITKQCVKCQKTYTLDNFRINNKTKDHRKNECKTCDSLRSKEYYTKNKKKIIKNIMYKRKTKKLQETLNNL